MKNQTKVDAQEVINKLVSKLAGMEYSQAILEAQVEDLKAENKKLREQSKGKEAKEA